MSKVKEFLKVLDSIDYSLSRYDKFCDFLQLTFSAMAKPMEFDNSVKDKREEDYMAVVKKYTDKGDSGYVAIREKFPKLLTIVVLALEEEYQDFLGSVAGEGEFLNSNLGQFFTPYSLSYMMAKITLGDVDTHVRRQKYLTVDEPACGSGSMLIAIADYCKKETEVAVSRNVWVRGTDLSKNCYMMTYIQASLSGLAGHIVWGNSLTLEVFDTAYLPASAYFIAMHGHPYWKAKKVVRDRVKKRIRKR